MKKICVYGLGYIGLPTACLLATHGYQVIGFDIKKETVEKINHGETPFNEVGLEKLLENALSKGSFSADIKPVASNNYIIAVPTPLNRDSRVADLNQVKVAARSIACFLKQGDLVILEATVPPRTCQKQLLPILEDSGLKAGSDFYLAYCPERAIPGNTINEMINNDRIIGGIDRHSAELARKMYSSFVRGDIHLSSLISAEIIKLMENTYRDINIAMANEFAKIAEESGSNIWEDIELANKHPRVNILKPGPGVGGHCLAIDPWFLTESSTRSRIISLAREINDSMPGHVLTLVNEIVGQLKDPVITVLGVAYKANVDDTRESPALKFIEIAKRQNYKVKVHDPHVKSSEYPLLSLKEAIKNSDCLILLTDHDLFKETDPVEVAPLLRTKNLVDTRNILDHQKWRHQGFTVRILGDGRHQG